MSSHDEIEDPIDNGAASQITRPMIATIKQEIKAEIEKLGADDSDATLAYLLQRIHQLEDSISAPDLTRRFVYIIYALIHHDHFTGLTAKQIEGLTEIAKGVLSVAKIRPFVSLLAALHGDLHTILSQIHRKRGEHWDAAWQQNLADILSRPSEPPGGEAFQAMTMANRAMRLGHLNLANEGFLSAESGETAGPVFERARYGRIHALRLAGSWNEAEALITSTLENHTLSSDMRQELAWERLCCTCSRANDILPLVNAVGRSGTHREPSYVVEALLWAYAFKSQKYIERLPKPSTLRSKKEYRIQSVKLLLNLLSALEECYDRSLPLVNRLTKIETVLSDRQKIHVLDKELLLLLAAGRWLDRSKAIYLTKLTVNEFRFASLRLSMGATEDCLGIADDIFTRAEKKKVA